MTVAPILIVVDPSQEVKWKRHQPLSKKESSNVVESSVFLRGLELLSVLGNEQDACFCVLFVSLSNYNANLTSLCVIL